MRLPHYDYSMAGAYFITICTKDKQCLFGRIENGIMLLNDYGKTAEYFLRMLPERYTGIILDEYVVMPNHVHAIIIITGNDDISPTSPQPPSLPLILGFYKMNSAKEINRHRQTPGFAVWQRSYYDRIIRNDRELEEIRTYICNNPSKWEYDKDNC